jgi:DNA polymerase III subunit beta
MEIKVSRDEIFKAVSRVQSIIEKRSNMPILSTILISAADSHINLSATDLEISLQQKLSAEVVTQGSITISGRKFFEILKESRSEKIHIKRKDNDWLFISDDHTKYNLACLSPDEYPVFIEPEGVSTIEIDASILSEMINKTIFSVTMEEAGFKLSGVFTEKVVKDGKQYFRMVSTDGHRLSLVDKEIEKLEELNLTNGVMIPKKGMLELNKLASDGGKISLGFKQSNCIAKKDNSLIVIRLLESKFPDYNSVIPKNIKHTINVKKEEILYSMRKMIILTSESYRGVKITLENNQMEFVSINPELGDVKDVINIEYNDERLELGFNSKYFMDVLQAMESEAVEIGFIDNSSPCLFHGKEDAGFLGLVMPMRI